MGSLGAPQPVWSPDGRFVAYTSDRDGAPDIWLWSAEEGTDRRLTRLSARANGLAWSPDGAWIAFAGDRFGNMDIWKVSVPGGEVHRLTSDPLYEGYPSWAPDSGALFYVRMDDRWVDHDVIEITPDGRNPRTVVADRGFFDYRAGRGFGAVRPSPDGEHLLFRSQRSGWLNFWIAPRTGGEPRPLAASDHDQSDARWSPDGAWVSYTENQGGVHSLRLAAADGSGGRTLVEREAGAALRPEWSPEGNRISYTFETPVRPAELFVLDVASGESALVHSEIGLDANPRIRAPRKNPLPEHGRPHHRGLPAPAAGRSSRRTLPRPALDPRRTHVPVRQPVPAASAGPLLRPARLRRAHAEHSRQFRLRPRLRGPQQRLLGTLRPRGCPRGGGLP